MSRARAPLALVSRGDDAPLAIAGVCARGGVADALVDALLGLDDAALARLRGVRARFAAGAAGDGAGELVVVVTGPADALPWRDGVVYLGAIAPGLYVPTTRATSLPPAVAAEALARHLPAAWLQGPSAGAPGGVLVPLRAALPLSRASLAGLDDARGAVGEGA